MRQSLVALLGLLAVVSLHAGCSGCFRTSCSTNEDCGDGYICDGDVCRAGDTSTSSGSTSSSSSGNVTSQAGSSGSSAINSSSRVSSSGSSSRASSVGSSSGVVTSSSAAMSSSRPPLRCPGDCAGDAGMGTWACSSGGMALTACTPSCAPGYGNCNGGGCFTDLNADPTNCGGCGLGLGTDGGANTCNNGAPACLHNTLVSVCAGAQPFCKPNEGCVRCGEDSQCAANEVCCGNNCVPMDGAACGCDVDNPLLGRACSAADGGGQCIVVSSGRPAVTAADYHGADCGCDFMSVLPVAVNICNAVSGFLGLCGPPTVTGNVGICIAQNDAPRNGLVAAEDCGARGNTCDPLKGGLTCVVQDGGVGRCACDGVADFASCAVPARDDGGFAHVVASQCNSGLRVCQCTTTGGVPIAACNDATPDCCENSGCFNLRGDEQNCGACGATCGDATSPACLRMFPDAGWDIFTCTCDVQTDCNSKPNVNTCLGGTVCACGTYIHPVLGQTACPVGTYCCSATDVGCCDKPCGTANNVCRTTP